LIIFFILQDFDISVFWKKANQRLTLLEYPFLGHSASVSLISTGSIQEGATQQGIVLKKRGDDFFCGSA
jgi:hypothetical protein